MGKPLEIGDYTIKMRDYETELVQEISDDIIDADRLCRLERDNGMPNFALYRLILARDMGYLSSVRMWWVLFSIEWCRNNMRSAFSTDLAAIAAWDSLRRLIEPNAEQWRADLLAESLEVDLETYTRARNSLKEILEATLSTYWGLLSAMYRIVVSKNRRFS